MRHLRVVFLGWGGGGAENVCLTPDYVLAPTFSKVTVSTNCKLRPKYSDVILTL